MESTELSERAAHYVAAGRAAFSSETSSEEPTAEEVAAAWATACAFERAAFERGYRAEAEATRRANEHAAGERDLWCRLMAEDTSADADCATDCIEGVE